MTVTPQTLPKRELIGLSAEVIQSTNRSLVGIKGIVTAETRGMLELGTKKVPKRGTRFMFTLPDGTRAAIDGENLIGRPESRFKAKRKKKW